MNKLVFKSMPSAAILFVLIGILFGCTNLQYGQIDCAVLHGEAARMCQEYRQRKADADIRAAAAELAQGFNKCLTKYSNPVIGKTKCSIYIEPLKDLGLKATEAN